MAHDRRGPLQGASTRYRRGGRQSRHGAYKRGLNTKIHLAVDANGNPVRIFVTAGTTADCKLGEKLISGIDAIALLADRGYDVNQLIDLARSAGMEIVIPPKKNRKEQRNYDKALYKLRHLVENAFLMLKQWRGIATRYAKNTESFLAAVRIRSLFHWATLQAR